MQTDFLTDLGVKTPRQQIAERAAVRREERNLQRSRNASKRAMQARERESVSATCCINFYSRRKNGTGWTHCFTCGKALIYQ